MKTLQFEGVKVALKQDKTGYVLNLSMHPDDVPEELLRDFVGARYQVVTNPHEAS
jgi:transposase